MKVSAVKVNDGKVYFQNRLKDDTRENYYEYANLHHIDYKKTAAYSASVIAAGMGIVYLTRNLNISQYAKNLARSIEAVTGKKVNPQSLSCIMGGDELLKILPKLEKKNYDASAKNMSNGIFVADLHSHSNYSDGNGHVKNLLEDAAEYADILYKKTKQKFIFALTDNDTMEGVKEALEIISSNPSRYKHLRFVPALEVSFAHKAQKSNNQCEMSEVLVYGINPYSEKLNKFVNNIKNKRTGMVNSFINAAFQKCPLSNFNFDEFANFYEFRKYGNVMNIHWRVKHYADTKHAVSILAGRNKENPNVLYDLIMRDNKGASLGQLHEYGKVPGDIKENPEFNEIFNKYAPHFENGKLVSVSENTFEEVIDAFKDEKNIFMAFAHPSYLAEVVDNPYQELKYLTEHSKGLIKASESYYQAYNDGIKKETVEYLQSKTESLNLLNIGGRDNHESKLF